MQIITERADGLGRSLLLQATTCSSPGPTSFTPKPVADLFLGYLCNRSHLPTIDMDRKALRLLPLHPPRPRIEQDASRIGV